MIKNIDNIVGVFLRCLLALNETSKKYYIVAKSLLRIPGQNYI